MHTKQMNLYLCKIMLLDVIKFQNPPVLLLFLHHFLVYIHTCNLFLYCLACWELRTTSELWSALIDLNFEGSQSKFNAHWGREIHLNHLIWVEALTEAVEKPENFTLNSQTAGGNPLTFNTTSIGSNLARLPACNKKCH